MSQLDHVSRFHVPDPETLNRSLLTEFEACRDDDELRKTHLFGGRYENLYTTEQQMPSLSILLEHARSEAARILDVAPEALAIGHWANAMYPGHVTTRHSHDDYDEKLSGVYYVHVPDRSGDLLIHADGEVLCIKPSEGLMMFFPPDLDHEVSEHRGQGLRLSIAMNFGMQNLK